MRFEQILANLAKGSSEGVGQVMAQLARGQLTQAMAAELISVVVATANAQGIAAAELVAAAWTDTLTTGAAVAPRASVATRLDDARLAGAVEKIFSGDEETILSRMTRLAESEPTKAAQQAMGAAIKESGAATGWTRGLNAEACELCQWWERDGQVWPTDHDMPTHAGCMCIQVPTTYATR